MTTPKERMLELIALRGGRHGWAFTPCGGPDYFMASNPRLGKREAVHVAIDGSIRYSDAVRFGEIWSVGISG